MARSLAVKVPTASLIALLEDKIAKIKSDIANYPTAIKQYKEDYKAYKQELISVALNALRNDPTLLNDEDAISVSMAYNGREVLVSFNASLLTLPEEPVKPSDPNSKEWIGREHISRLEVLEKNLKVLRLTVQEEVNASTYSSVMDLL